MPAYATSMESYVILKNCENSLDVDTQSPATRALILNILPNYYHMNIAAFQFSTYIHS